MGKFPADVYVQMKTPDNRPGIARESSAFGMIHIQFGDDGPYEWHGEEEYDIITEKEFLKLKGVL